MYQPDAYMGWFWGSLYQKESKIRFFLFQYCIHRFFPLLFAACKDNLNIALKSAILLQEQLQKPSPLHPKRRIGTEGNNKKKSNTLPYLIKLTNLCVLLFEMSETAQISPFTITQKTKMKKRLKKTITALFITSLPIFTLAQSGSIEAAYDTLTVEGQFDHLFSRSNRFEDYKVMKMTSYEALKQNTLDSMKFYTNQVSKLQLDIKNLNNRISDQGNEVQNLTQELENTKKIQDSMSFLGIHISKEAYNSVMWGLVICLLALSAVLFSLFRRGHGIVRATRKRLEEIQEDLENHRKNALLREQKLARELMDVKLKNKSTR